MIEAGRTTFRTSAVNYCKSCRRHLNGAVSCPGCGAVGVGASATQDSRSVDWTTEVSWPGPEPFQARGEESRASPRSVRHRGTTDEHEPVVASDAAAAGPPDTTRARRSRKRRRLGLGATVTGGFAGIAVIGLLVLGNLPTVGRDSASVGAVATESTAAPQQSSGAISTSGAEPLATDGGSEPTAAPTGSGAKSTASAKASAVSTKPSATETAIQPAVSAQSQEAQSTRPSLAATSPSTQTSPPVTQSTTPPSSPTASPSPSQTQVSCILIICW